MWASRDSAGGGGGTEHFCGGNHTLEVWKKQKQSKTDEGKLYDKNHDMSY